MREKKQKEWAREVKEQMTSHDQKHEEEKRLEAEEGNFLMRLCVSISWCVRPNVRMSVCLTPIRKEERRKG